MANKKIIEEQIYMQAIELFNDTAEINHDVIEKLIADACSASEAEGEGKKIDINVVVRNLLLLLLGSLHKDRPIDNLGQDIHDLPPRILVKHLKEIRGII